MTLSPDQSDPACLERRGFDADGPGSRPASQCDKAEHRVELTATVSEAVANAFENAKALQAEGSSVVVTGT